MMRDGMEALEMTNARMEELGMPGIGPGIRGDLRGPWRHRHGDHAAVGRQQWVTLTDFIAPDDSVTQPLVMEDSAQYAAENNISSQCTSG
jgi:branched-chain amino acid transport system substrate-binding protein